MLCYKSESQSECTVAVVMTRNDDDDDDGGGGGGGETAVMLVCMKEVVPVLSFSTSRPVVGGERQGLRGVCAIKRSINCTF